MIDDPHRFDGVKIIGVDEHVWRHTRQGDKYVTVIIDLTPIRDGIGPSRLLDMVQGRSKLAFAIWLKARPQHWRDGVEVVAMDGFSGFKSAAAEELSYAAPGHGSLPCHSLGWGSVRFMPAVRSAAELRSSRTGRGSVVFGQTDASYWGGPAH